MAWLRSFAATQPNALTDAMEDLGDGFYRVRFFREVEAPDGRAVVEPHYVTVSETLPAGGRLYAEVVEDEVKADLLELFEESRSTTGALAADEAMLSDDLLCVDEDTVDPSASSSSASSASPTWDIYTSTPPRLVTSGPTSRCVA